MSRNNPQGTENGLAVDAAKTIDELASLHDQGLSIPLSSQAIFWPARHPVPSPLLNKLPFLFWLMEVSRPRKVVQVGLGDGLIYMALCQAAERLGGQTFCLGIDPSGNSLPIDLQAPHDTQYGDISTLLQGLPPEGSKLARDADVLVLNTYLDDELSRIILESWLPMLSNRAIVLVCDPTHVLGSQDLRQVLLNEARHPVLTGTMSPGGELLDVILYGDEQPKRLCRLANAEGASPLHMAARQVFSRLGQGIEDARQIMAIKAENAGLRHRIEIAEDQIEQRESDLMTARSQIDLLQQTLASERTRTEASISLELAHSTQWKKEKSELTTRIDELEAEHAARIADIAVLMQQHEAQLSDLQRSHQQELEAIRHKQAETRTEVEALREEKVAMQVQYDEMVRGFHDSTSWRVTKPLRSLKLSFNR
ncbi:MAG: hypothetical protein ACU0BO_03245 [Limimaricola soesokkakensis]|uniref:hypothetical protein n=1 Tax=Limimaricola soesokkakensis TaxID=1343159 RepID=UPI004058CAB3